MPDSNLSTTLNEFEQRIDQLLTELSSYSINSASDYSVIGISRLVEAMARARAIAERSSSILSELYTSLSEIRRLHRDAQRIYQERYDESVSKIAPGKSHLSWEERASLYRLENIDDAFTVRDFEDVIMSTELKIKGAESISRILVQGRNDLYNLAQVLKMSQQLGELE